MATTKKRSSALTKPVTYTLELEAVVGKGPLPRTEIMKKLWLYIKKKGLQDTKNKRNINPDVVLSKIFGSTKTVDMFTMTSLVSKHIKSAPKTTCSSCK